VKLAQNNKEREMYDNLADLYSIIKTVEYLEKAYVRDSCTAREYTPACTKLIAQFNTALNLVGPNFNLEKFLQDYRLDCRAAIDRLTRSKVPATVEHRIPGGGNEARMVAEAVQYFITTMDSLKLNMTAVDQVQPLIVDLNACLNKIGDDFEGKEKVAQWLTILNMKQASDELDEPQVRQMLFDLESAYNAFHKSLASSDA